MSFYTQMFIRKFNFPLKVKLDFSCLTTLTKLFICKLILLFFNFKGEIGSYSIFLQHSIFFVDIVLLKNMFWGQDSKILFSLMAYRIYIFEMNKI